MATTITTATATATAIENATMYPSANMSTTISGSYVTLNPSTVTICNPWEERIKKYCDSIDKHVDQLEEDIEFLDKKRKETNDELIFLCDKVGKFECEINVLKGENAQLRADVNSLCEQIYELQQRLDNQ